jgi:hypothetical protein
VEHEHRDQGPWPDERPPVEVITLASDLWEVAGSVWRAGVRSFAEAFSAAAGFARRGSRTLGLKDEPIEVIMARAAGQTSIGSGRYWARTSDPQLVELVLSQLS